MARSMHRIVDAVELQAEEQEVARGGGEALLRVAVELRARRIGRVARIDEARIGHEAPEQILHRLVAPHGLPQGFRRAPATPPVRRACRDRSPPSPCTRLRPWRGRPGRIRCRCRDRDATGPIRATARGRRSPARARRPCSGGRSSEVDGSGRTGMSSGTPGVDRRIGRAVHMGRLRARINPIRRHPVKRRFTGPRRASRRTTTNESGVASCP